MVGQLARRAHKFVEGASVPLNQHMSVGVLGPNTGEPHCKQINRDTGQHSQKTNPLTPHEKLYALLGLMVRPPRQKDVVMGLNPKQAHTPEGWKAWQPLQRYLS